MANFISRLSGKQKEVPASSVSQLPPEFYQYEHEYIAYCIEQEQTVSNLENRLHESDDPKEIATMTLRTVCDFYGADWAGILDVDLDLDIWTPLWWHNTHDHDHTSELFQQYDLAKSMPNWVKSLKDGTPVVVPDVNTIQADNPKEYEIYRQMRVDAVMGFPFGPNPVGLLVIRNPKRYVKYPSALRIFAYVLHRAMAQQKTMERDRMKISPENIERDTDVVIHLFGNLDVYTSRGVIREADFKSPMICKMIAYLALHPKMLVPTWKMVALLWPDSEEVPDIQAKNVKYLLYRLRQTFGLISDYPLIESSASGYRLNPALNIMTDMGLFDQYQVSIHGTPSLSHKVELLKKAVELYEGHVFSTDNCEDWVMPTASHYALEYAGIINELLKIMAEAGDYSDLIRYAAKSLEIEPGNMRAHYWQIFALYRSGATEMAAASLPMAKRSLIEEDYAKLIELLREMKRKFPSEQGQFW